MNAAVFDKIVEIFRALIDDVISVENFLTISLWNFGVSLSFKEPPAFAK